MQGDFETLHTSYLDPPEPKVWGYDYNGFEIYTGDRYYEHKKDKVLEDDIEEYLRMVYLTEPPVTNIVTYDWKGNRTDIEANYYKLQGDYVNEDEVDEYLQDTFLIEPIRIAGE